MLCASIFNISLKKQAFSPIVVSGDATIQMGLAPRGEILHTPRTKTDFVKKVRA